MIKSIVLIATLLFTLSAFYIQVENDQSNEVKAIDWKFTTCGDGKWTIQSLTLGSIPARNTNDDIDVVINYLFRPELLILELLSPLLKLTSNLMEFLFTLKLLNMRKHTKKEIQLNSDTIISFHLSLLQELTDLLSNSSAIKPKMVVFISPLNYDDQSILI
jgi:hypothetical protein